MSIMSHGSDDTLIQVHPDPPAVCCVVRFPAPWRWFSRLGWRWLPCSCPCKRNRKTWKLSAHAGSETMLPCTRKMRWLACPLLLVTPLLLVAMPFAPSTSFLLLVVRSEPLVASSSVLAPSNGALCH